MGKCAVRESGKSNYVNFNDICPDVVKYTHASDELGCDENLYLHKNNIWTTFSI